MAVGSGDTDHGGDTHDDHSHGYGGDGPQRPPQGHAPIINQPTIKDALFNITCTGMKPDTVHKFYYEGQDLSSACRPIYPKPPGNVPVRYGSPLVTDEAGKIEFIFHFTVAIEKAVDASNKTTYELAGDKKFSLQAVNSSASKVVPYARGPRRNNNNNFLNGGKYEPPHSRPPGPTGNQH